MIWFEVEMQKGIKVKVVLVIKSLKSSIPEEQL